MASPLDSAEVVGFVLGTTDESAFKRRVRWKALPAIGAALCLRWALVPRFILGVFEGEPASPLEAELLLLAVSADYRRSGVASQLTQALESRFQDRGVNEYRVAVRSWLGPALEFYRRAGFVEETQANVLGAPMTYLTKALTEERNQNL